MDTREEQAVDDRLAQGLLGYLNFSDGRPDPRWQKQVNDAYAEVVRQGVSAPWQSLLDELRAALPRLQASGGAAFRDIAQASRVLELVLDVLPAYRRHHADLLAHLDETELFGPFFLARVFEVILREHQSGEVTVAGIITRLNDFVGHRPIAILETRPQGEPYEHERHRPLPVYLRGAGIALSRYQAVLDRALKILAGTDASLLNEACFSLELMDELAIDLRAYDHGHPVNRRPNYVFGEWDPHQIDNQGRYRRFVARKITLDALMDRVENLPAIDPEERLFEGAAVLAGTMLMAAGFSGWGPGAHDSSTTLATLLPRIARYRDAFYQQLLLRLTGSHATRLRQEQETTRQPFGAARQHLNAYLARHRATQLQHRCLALLFAEMGYPRSSQMEARRIPAVSMRLLSEILIRLTAGRREADLGRWREAMRFLPEIEALLHRGIACGAFADPWNILGFQGLFPLSPAREDSIRDPRLDELIQVVEQTFHLHARLTGEAATAGETEAARQISRDMERLASWWDRFATSEVSDLRHVHGGDSAEAARNVAEALAGWRQRGEAAADLGFWRQRVGGFRSPHAYALVVEALLTRGDHKAALGLLASWLSQAHEVPLEDGAHSFHHLTMRWLLSLTRLTPPPGPGESSATETNPEPEARELVLKFFDHLEANADEYWNVPALMEELPVPREDDEGDPFEAAYEDMTWRDSTGDEDDGGLADASPRQPFDLEEQSERLEKRLRFLSTIARLWHIATRFLIDSPAAARLGVWLDTARRNRKHLLTLLDNIQAHSLPEPSGDYDSLVEYDRRRVVKEQLLYATISTCADTSLAIGALRGVLGREAPEDDPGPAWESRAILLERAMIAGDADTARTALSRFSESFRAEPLLFTPLSEGEPNGPRSILRVRTNQAVLRGLLGNLPRLGLLRETCELLRTARSMEQSQPTRGRGVTEFNHFFQSAYQSAVECIVTSSSGWETEHRADDHVVDLLERLTAPFLALWIEHSRTLQLSVLENVTSTSDWQGLTSFVQRYGSDLFHARFLTLGNLRGILHRGVGEYLDYLRDNPDPMRKIRLLDDLGGKIRREDAVRRLEVVLQSIVEHYEEYKDYNTTTTQSDYGENLHVLLDFLRLKVGYERHAWQFRPLVMAHEILARHGRSSTALRWEQSLTQFTRELARQHLEQLQTLERQHGMRLSTVSDRLHERFVKPLALDRLCALIEPCLRESRTIETEDQRPAFARLQQELRAYSSTPTGVGLDVPAWLRRMEAEVQKVQARRTAVAQLAENFFRIPRRIVTHDEVLRQLRDWERPALPQ